MKRLYYIIFTALALVAFHPFISAQPGVTIGDDGNPSEYQINGDGIGYAKAISGPNNDGVYTIHLHTFVTGDGTITHSSLPADVVLVLDVSGSMEDDMPEVVTYTEQTSQGYSYRDIGNNSSYYYLYNGQYYQVQRTSQGGGMFSSTRYYLRVRINNQWYYFNGTGDPSTTQPTGPTNQDTDIWTGVLYLRTATTESKMDVLKRSVKAFVDLIKENDDDGNGGSLGNTISIVKFADDSYYDNSTSSTATGNHKYTGRMAESGSTMEPGSSNYNANNFNSSYYYNLTEIVKGFTDVATGSQDLKNAVDALQPGGSTAADYAMNKALALVKTLYKTEDGVTTPKRESNKTVVFFTDGDPNHSDGFNTTVANAAILAAKSIKSYKAYTDENGNDVNVSVYSVSVFDSQNNNRTTYMNKVSSNFPTAETMTDNSTGTTGGKYYQDASSGNLEDIFRSIADEAGGNSKLDDATLTTIDVVSQSFVLPGDVSDVVIYEADVIAVADDGTLTFAPKDNWHLNPDGVTIVPDEDDPNKVTVTGFDYASNYCGTLTVDGGTPQPHGSKLVLQIPIEMAEDAVGGPGVDTNGPGSGIYVNGKNELVFESPVIDLPVNLQVKKVGLNMGESAKFKIQRVPKTSNPSTVAETAWEDVTTIFVTKSAASDPDVYIRGLDPNYYYRVYEEDWGWSYNFVSASGEGYVENETTHQKEIGTVTVTDKTKVTSDKFISNPITFTDSPKTGIDVKVRHAESKANNTFNGTDPVYVDSKTNTRGTTPTETTKAPVR